MRRVSPAMPSSGLRGFPYGIAGLLLCVLGVALVHEFVPGLCPLLEDESDDCPFCLLVSMLALTIVVAAYVLGRMARDTGPTLPAVRTLRQGSRPSTSLRGPPQQRVWHGLVPCYVDLPRSRLRATCR